MLRNRKRAQEVAHTSLIVLCSRGMRRLIEWEEHSLWEGSGRSLSRSLRRFGKIGRDIFLRSITPERPPSHRSGEIAQVNLLLWLLDASASKWTLLALDPGQPKFHAFVPLVV